MIPVSVVLIEGVVCSITEIIPQIPIFKAMTAYRENDALVLNGWSSNCVAEKRTAEEISFALSTWFPGVCVSVNVCVCGRGQKNMFIFSNGGQFSSKD